MLRPDGRLYSCEMTARFVDSRPLRAVSRHPADGDRPTPDASPPPAGRGPDRGRPGDPARRLLDGLRRDPTVSSRPAPSGPVGTARAALRVVRRRWRPDYPAVLAATLVNTTVPDVVRQLLVRDDPHIASAVLVDVVGFATGLVAELWVTGAVAALPTGGALARAGGTWRGAAPSPRSRCSARQRPVPSAGAAADLPSLA